MAYEGLEPHEYLDLSHHSLGLEGMINVFRDLAEDTMLKQVNLSYNSTQDDVFRPEDIEYFFKRMKYFLAKNKTLTALNLEGNALFYYHPHPTNEHVKNYEMELTDALIATKLTHIDLSNNNIAGYKGREVHGLTYFTKKFLFGQGKAFQCRLSNLNSFGLQCITHCLGPASSMTYLDLSDNSLGLDPHGVATSEGIITLAKAISQSCHLRTLRLARTKLRDDDVEYISDAVKDNPTFRDLDLSGNLFRHFGFRNLKNAIVNLGNETGEDTGFRFLSLSNNAIGEKGLIEITEAITRTFTIEVLQLAHCSIPNNCFQRLYDAISDNVSLMHLDVEGNGFNEDEILLLNAEVEANKLVEDIKFDPMSVDTNDLTDYMYLALSRKLRFLSQTELAALYENATFVVPDSTMREALQSLEPPPRRYLFHEVKANAPGIMSRLEAAKVAVRRADAAMVVFRNVFRWFDSNRKKRSLMLALEEMKRREEEARERFTFEDDLLSYSSNLSKSSRSLGSISKK